VTGGAVAARDAALTLLRTPGLGPVTLAKLHARLGSAEAIVNARPGVLRDAGLSEVRINALQQADAGLIAPDLAWLAAGPDRHILLFDDARYPERLRQTPGAPLLLFVHGDPDWLAMPQLAIVGSRSATPQGALNARSFAEALAARGITIASGLALGIDGAAHEGALAAKGGTVAVCATGLDRVYPARHQALARQIAAEGALVSEFPIGTVPQQGFFPRRNRVISALSLGVLVVEAARESGSLITARFAMEQGREVFAIPGSIHNPQARGCHALIRQGAKLVESVDDILEELAPQLVGHLRDAPAVPDAEANGGGEALTPEADALLAVLGDEALEFDTLLARSGASVATLSAQLLTLELSGRVVQGADGRYRALRGT
jgi:DNA processing protein